MFQFNVWFLPVLILAFTTALAIPFSRYLAWIMDGRYQAPRFLQWIDAVSTRDRRTGSNTRSLCSCSTR